MNHYKMNNYSMGNSTSPEVDPLLTKVLLASDIFALYCFAVHLVYLVLIVFIDELRQKSFFYINHSVLASLLYPISTLIFQYFDPSSVENETQITIICSIFEIYWPFSIYIRMYAILLIAVHRYIAVFKMELFNRVNKSNAHLFGSVAFIWFVSLSFTFISKYAFKTSYSVTFCLNGFSPNFVDSLLYALFYMLFAMILPAIAIVTLYVMIYMRMQRAEKRLSIHQLATDSIHKAKEMRFANQFVIMCTVVCLSISGNFVSGLKGVIPNYFYLFYYWRPILRCYIMFVSSLVPILAFYFTPFRRRILHFC